LRYVFSVSRQRSCWINGAVVLTTRCWSKNRIVRNCALLGSLVLMWGVSLSYGDAGGATTPASKKVRGKAYSELRQQVKNALESIHALEAKLDHAESSGTDADLGSLRQQLNEELEHIAAIERQLSRLDANATSASATAEAAASEGEPKEKT